MAAAVSSNETDAAPYSEPWTPRMAVLRRLSREQVENERIRLAEDLAALLEHAARARHEVEALARRTTADEQALDRAKQPLGDTDRAKRRLAEQDPTKTPDALVADRREAGWERRLKAAHELHQSTGAQLAKAAQALRYREDLIAQRKAMAAAAASRHDELGRRREATYLQQLVRSHPRGPELNDLLKDYRVGPDQPAWVIKAEKESGS